VGNDRGSFSRQEWGKWEFLVGKMEISPGEIPSNEDFPPE